MITSNYDLSQPHFNSLLEMYQDDGFGNAVKTHRETDELVYALVLEDLH